MSKAREAFEKWLGENPTYSECCGRYVNHVINEQWKVWKHQQSIIDEMKSRAESEFRQRFEDGWAGKVAPLLAGVKVRRDPYLAPRNAILSPDLYDIVEPKP